MKRINRGNALAAVGLAVALLGLTGCAHSRSYEYSDKRITKRVATTLSNTPGYNYPGVTVHTYNGVVQLDGYVDSPAQKIHAEQVAANVPGVREVVDNLRTAPPPTGSHVPIIRREGP